MGSGDAGGGEWGQVMLVVVSGAGGGEWGQVMLVVVSGASGGEWGQVDASGGESSG